MGFHSCKLGYQRVGERIRIGKAGKRSDPTQLLRLVRQNVGLLVTDHLQAVLDTTQEEIGFAEIFRRSRLDPGASRQFRQGFDRAARPQLGMPAAGNELLGLREELDVTDAAAPKLDVVAGDGDRVVAFMGMHAPLHGVDIGDRREVEIFAPYEGFELTQELLSGLDIAGNNARLDQGGAFPILPKALVIGQPGVGRKRHLRRARVRPQPQIGPENIAVAGMLLKESHQLARHPHEEGGWFDAWRELSPVGVVEHDDVDVAGIVELLTAELTHGDDEIALGGHCRRAADLSGSVRLAKQKLDGLIDGSVRGVAHGAQRVFRRPDLAKVGEADK